MRPIATGGVVYVCVSDDPSVGHVRESCKNDWTDRDTVWELTRETNWNHVLDEGPDPPKGRDNFWGVWPTEKHCRPLLRCTLQNINDGTTQPLLQRCRLVGVTLHCPPWRIPPAMRPFV